MSENPTSSRPAVGAPPHPGLRAAAIRSQAHRTVRTAAIASTVIAGIVTAAVATGVVAALLAPRDGAFPLALAVAGTLALAGGILGGPLLRRLTADATSPPLAAGPPLPAEGDHGDR